MKSKVEIVIAVIWGFFIRLALIAGLVYFLYRTRSILVDVLLAVMLTYVMLPVVEFLCKIHIRGWKYKSCRFWASIVVFAVLLAATGIVFVYVVAPFVQEARDLAAQVSATRSLDAYSKKAAVWLDRLPPDLTNLAGPAEKAKAVEAARNWLLGILSGTISWLQRIVDVILIPIIAFYFVLDYRSLRREFVGALPRARRREALHLLRHTGAILQNYVIGQLILCLIAGVLVGLVLWALEMKYALALGVLAGVTRAIPIIGPIISGIAIVAYALLTSPLLAIYLLIFFCLLQLVESKVLLPLLIGERMRMHPAVIIIVLLIGAEFFGILGMFLAAPVAAAARELVRFYVIEPRTKQENGYKNDEGVEVY